MTGSPTDRPFQIPTGLLAGRKSAPEAAKPEEPKPEPASEPTGATTQPELNASVAITASDLGLTEEEFAARQAKKSIEIDLREIGVAKTVERPATPIPPPLATPPITPPRKEELPPPPPPLYTGLSLRLEPSMADVGQGVRVVMIGAKADGTSEELNEPELATMSCDPLHSGKFAFSVFLPEKEGSIIIRAALADAGGAMLHEAQATLTVNAAAKVELSHSMQNVVAPSKASPSAPTQLAAPAAKPLTVSELPIERKFFGDKPKAMTFGGSPIYPPPGETPDTAPKPSNNVVETKAVTGWRARRLAVEKQASELAATVQRNPKKSIAITLLAILFGAAITVVAGHYLFNGEMRSGADALSAPTTSVTIVADAGVVAEAMVPVGVDPPPVAHPTVAEPGLTGTPGTRVTMSARDAFPVSCLTGWSAARTDGIRFYCGPTQRHGDDVCDCMVVGVVPR